MARVKTQRTVLVALAVVVPILAALAVGLAGFRWYSAAHDEALAQAQQRETVLRQAEQAAINLNTLDYRNVEQGLQLWQRSTTGALHDELSSNAKRYAQVIGQGKVKTQAEVRGSAVKRLNPASQTAVVLIGIDVTVIPDSGKPTAKRERLRLTMSNTPQGWKASRVQAIQA